MRLPSPPADAGQHERITIRALETILTQMEENIREGRVRPTVVDIAVSFDDSGRAHIAFRFNEDTLSFRYAVSSEAAPTAETVRLAEVVAGDAGTATLAGPFSAGSVLYVSALAYAGPNGDGREGDLRSSSATRGERIYQECRAAVVASTADTITVEVSGASTAGIVSVQIVSIDGSASIVDGLGLGVQGSSPQRYVIARPFVTSSEILCRASFPDADDDEDTLVIPEVGFAPLIFLASRARLLELTATEMQVRYVVADPFPQGAGSVNATTTLDGVPAISPDAVVPLDPAAVFSGTAGTFQDYVITRPAFGAADGQVRFTVQSVGGLRVPDSDLVLVPAKDSVPPWLEIVRSLSPDGTEATIEWDGGPNVTLDKGDGLSFQTPPASPITVLRGAVSGGVDKVYTFRAEGDLFGVSTVATQDILIPKMQAVPPGSPAITGVLPTINDADDFDVTWSESNMPGGQTYSVEYEITAGGPGTVVDGPHTVDPSGPSPVNIAHDMSGGGVEGIVTVRAYDGAELIAEGTFVNNIWPT